MVNNPDADILSDCRYAFTIEDLLKEGREYGDTLYVRSLDQNKPITKKELITGVKKDYGNLWVHIRITRRMMHNF